MKKIIQCFMVASIFAACNSKSDLDTNKDVILTDTTGMYKSNMMTDTGSVIETSTVTPGTQNRTAVANRRTTNTNRATAPRTKARTYSNNNTRNSNTGSNNGSNTSNTSNNGGSNQTTTAPAPQKTGMSSAAKGAIIGGVGGAVVGGVVKGGKGAVIGGVAGAAGGYIIGRKKDKRTGRAQ